MEHNEDVYNSPAGPSGHVHKPGPSLPENDRDTGFPIRKAKTTTSSRDGKEEDSELEALTAQLELVNLELDVSKAPEGSDYVLALLEYRDGLENMRTAILDRRFCARLPTINPKDAVVIGSFLAEEQRAENDHRLAMRLSGRSVPEPARDEGPSTSAGCGEPIQTCPRTPKHTCNVCLEKKHILVTTECSPESHKFCYACLKRLYEAALGDEELMPVRCCGKPLARSVSRSVLNPTQLARFDVLWEEVHVTSRVYCPNPRCSAFLGEQQTREAKSCPSCQTEYCAGCGQTPHEGVCVHETEGEAELRQVAESKGWRQCQRCKRVVELSYGCNHMTCRCGNQFCYVCGVLWKGCRCDVWEEGRLVERANEVARDQNRNVNEVVEHLRAHNEANCVHNYARVGHGRTRGCEGCGYPLYVYHFHCRNCFRSVCYTCRFFRER